MTSLLGRLQGNAMLVEKSAVEEAILSTKMFACKRKQVALTLSTNNLKQIHES